MDILKTSETDSGAFYCQPFKKIYLKHCLYMAILEASINVFQIIKHAVVYRCIQHKMMDRTRNEDMDSFPYNSLLLSMFGEVLP